MGANRPYSIIVVDRWRNYGCYEKELVNTTLVSAVYWLLGFDWSDQLFPLDCVAACVLHLVFLGLGKRLAKGDGLLQTTKNLIYVCYPIHTFFWACIYITC